MEALVRFYLTITTRQWILKFYSFWGKKIPNFTDKRIYRAYHFSLLADWSSDHILEAEMRKTGNSTGGRV